MRVMLVEDHAVFRSALRELFATKEPSFEVVAEAATAQDAWRLADQQHPEVTIMDVFLRGESGISATRELCRRQRGARVMMLTAIDNPSFVREAFAAGARGYALKEQTADEIISAIRIVAGGARYLPSRFDPELLGGDGKKTPQPDGLFGQLSAREREIFDLVVAGHGNQRIASELFISVKTVETHRARINRKLGVHSGVELVRFAALHGRL
jgi:two-component system, NarL family, response regulator NreC